MLGFHVSVYRLVDGGAAPAAFDAAQGDRVAVWQCNNEGLSWFGALVEAERARFLGGNGYPLRYTARAADVIPRVIGGPPAANAFWRADPHDVLTEAWAGATTVDRAAADACRPDEWLLIEAWDES